MDTNDDDRANQEFQRELYERTIEVLDRIAALGIPDSDMRLLGWHCGIDFDKEIKPYVAHG